MQKELEKRGILVRIFDNYILEGQLRVTVGKPEHSDLFLAALDRVGLAAGRR